MIFVTGDTHGTYDLQKLIDFNKHHQELTKNDYVIICGDAAVCWNEQTDYKTIDIYESFNFTTLYLDGNHENFDLINSKPTIEMFGSRVHKISDSIYHLIRGNVYDIQGLLFFVFGGAESIDKYGRIPFVSWWPNELPTQADIDNAIKNIDKYNVVDFVLTHTIDLATLQNQTDIYQEKYKDYTCIVLDEFDKKLGYSHWYFGHFHMDREFTNKKTCLYNDILQII